MVDLTQKKTMEGLCASVNNDDDNRLQGILK